VSFRLPSIPALVQEHLALARQRSPGWQVVQGFLRSLAYLAGHGLVERDDRIVAAIIAYWYQAFPGEFERDFPSKPGVAPFESERPPGFASPDLMTSEIERGLWSTNLGRLASTFDSAPTFSFIEPERPSMDQITSGLAATLVLWRPPGSTLS
jgi:hypothetical protein